jgi:hypothetical protein
MMTASPASTTSPGNEGKAGGVIHHLVFSPRTPPLGQETDVLITRSVTELSVGGRLSLDLILRVSDPEQVHRYPDVDYWLIVRVYPERASFRVDGPSLTFNGTAFKLADGVEGDEAITCTAKIQVLDLPAGVIIGELQLTYGGNT